MSVYVILMYIMDNEHVLKLLEVWDPVFSGKYIMYSIFFRDQLSASFAIYITKNVYGNMSVSAEGKF